MSTWDITNSSGSIVLSELDLTATLSGNPRNSIGNTLSRNSGKYYFEVECRDNPPNLSLNWEIGLVQAAPPTGTPIGAGAFGTGAISYAASGGAYVRSSFMGAINAAGWSVGDIIGIAVNFSTPETILYINGVDVGSSVIMASAFPLPVSPGVSLSNLAIANLRTTDAQFTHAAPAGFLAWDEVATNNVTGDIDSPCLDITNAYIVTAFEYANGNILGTDSLVAGQTLYDIDVGAYTGDLYVTAHPVSSASTGSTAVAAISI